ncbi:XamI family restriction endonuclease [Methylomonas sp. MK1]|uniref:XamI family restriction endonuclease n=1 Tax=Methylomonas sp. MK1 TaxID=1131552 RepID=UPI00035E62DA|nr:XamI family restriction endonuclease [Methylomonas sp. MK1]
MTISPKQWTTEELTTDATTSKLEFRSNRLAATTAWTSHYQAAREKFELLFQHLNNLNPDSITNAALADAYDKGLGEALRYLAGPPISDDDLKVIADIDSLKPSILGQNPDALSRVFSVIDRVIDPHRFPWLKAEKTEDSVPTEQQIETAILASSVLLAAQRIATERRNDGKTNQETQVKDYLRSVGFSEVAPATINTIVKGPQAMQFCVECKLGDRKADVIIRLHDTRLLAIECKVSNSATNSVKRLNNDAAVKAEYWLKKFGTSQIVPAAVLSGVFNVLNLEQAQERGLALYWAHDLRKLGDFIQSTST